MPLGNTTNLISDIKSILDNPPSDVQTVAQLWSNAIANWLSTVSSPPAQSLTSELLSSVMFPILNVKSDNFLNLLNSALSAAANLVIADTFVVSLITQGAIVTPPTHTVTFASALPIGLAGGSESTAAIATAISTEFVTWGFTGTFAGSTWV